MAIDGLTRNVLVYVDGSEECIAAAQAAVIMAKKLGANLHALYVVNVSLLEELLKARILVKLEEMDYRQDLERDGRRYLHYVAELAKKKGVEMHTELVKGVGNREVVKYVQEKGIDLLFMGEFETMHATKDTHFDEQAWIFKKAECSIMIVKRPDHVERVYNALD
ncbi:universal stress protein [bacterium]|nr:universal stress protein [bacterium]